jgi:hypothetical protein
MSQNLSSFLTSWCNRRLSCSKRGMAVHTPRLGGSAYGSIRYAYGFDVSGESNPKSNPLSKGATLEIVCRRVSSSKISVVPRAKFPVRYRRSQLRHNCPRGRFGLEACPRSHSIDGIVNDVLPNLIELPPRTSNSECVAD